MTYEFMLEKNQNLKRCYISINYTVITRTGKICFNVIMIIVLVGDLSYYVWKI